jgi:hypothetical protein
VRRDWYVYRKGARAMQCIRTAPRVFFDHWNLSDISMNEPGDVCAKVPHPVYPERHPVVFIIVDTLDAIVTADQYADSRR